MPSFYNQGILRGKQNNMSATFCIAPYGLPGRTLTSGYQKAHSYIQIYSQDLRSAKHMQFP